jgi:predicted phosphoribosyltransferase
VAHEIARRLHVPLDVFIVRKLGVPGFEELAVGAIASGDIRVLNDDVVRVLPDAQQVIENATVRERIELDRRERLYRDDRPSPELRDRTVILVDDGLATGATMRAAVSALRQRGVAKIVIAVPVGAPDTCRALEGEVDEMVCGISPNDFHAVGQFYEDFSQTSDDEVRDLLGRACSGGL